MPKFEVVSEFVDKETGERIQAGTVFEASGKRVEALRAAGVIGEEVKGDKKAGDGDGAKSQDGNSSGG